MVLKALFYLSLISKQMVSTSNISVIAAKPENTFNKVAINALSQWKYKVESKGKARDMTVQLDFLMDHSSSKPENLVERIKVTKSH